MVWLGALIAFVAAAANAVALVLQASEAAASSAGDGARFILLWRLARRRRWVLGTALLTVTWPLQILALSFAPLTVVQPMLATFQLILLVIARLMLHHRAGLREWSGALAVTAGVTLVILAAPHRELAHPPALRLAVPLVLVGVAALVAYLSGRSGRRGLVLAIGAGLGYAWVDFTDKLVSNAIALGHALAAVLWLLAVMGFGVVALLLESTALQRRSPVLVAPVIGALQEPLPVLMALGAGLEAWNGGPLRAATLAAGVAISTSGAVLIARSPALVATRGRPPEPATG